MNTNSVRAKEFNFDGLVGPTHNYAGLSVGNVASQVNQGNVSNPKKAAKQGLRKMLTLHELGLAQAVLPPQERPSIKLLSQCGFSGSDSQIIKKAANAASELFHAACSASSMWTANAATVSPSADTVDGKVHFTPANLVSKLHRSIEDETTTRVLKSIFTAADKFTIHPPLPHHQSMGDEGAANHTRFCPGYASTGLEFFVYGQHYFNKSAVKPERYPARQTLEASQAIIRSHQLKSNSCLLTQQNPKVIDQGVFHNDVIAVGNLNVLFYHQHAFVNEQEVRNSISNFFNDHRFYFIRVDDNQVSIDDAVKSYLFNSQIVCLNQDALRTNSREETSMALVLPGECEENQSVWRYLQELKAADNPIDTLIVKDLRESMANGGGPACLRLRVVLTDEESAAINSNVIINKNLFERLDQWVDKHYRDRIDVHSLADPQLLVESRTALDELTVILNLGSIYPFQR